MTAAYPPNERDRLARLYEYDVLDTSHDDLYDDLTRLAALICEAPIAFISLIDDERQWFKSVIGIELEQIPRCFSFCTHTILQADIMVVPDAVADERFKENPFVTGDPHVRFYAGMPLVTPEGYAVGSLCVVDTAPHTLTDEQQMTLRILARQVVNQLELRRQIADRERRDTERVLAETARRRSDESLRQLGEAFVHAVEGIVITDARLPDVPITYCNPAFLALSGYAQEEILGRNCRFLQGPDTDPIAVRQLHEAVRAGQCCRVTLRNYKKDGTLFWNELTVAPIRDEAGTLTHFVGMQHDVTAVVSAETARRETDRRLDDVLESVSDAVVVLDKEWRYTYVNTRAARVFDRKPEDLIGRHIWTEFPECVGEKFYHTYHKAVEDQTPLQVEEYYPPYDRWFENRIYPNGNGLSIFFQDVTARKTAELEREHLLVEAMERADRDPLTNVLNHRVFQNHLDYEAAHALQSATVLAVIVLDLDNFRFFNDVYGHSTGDGVLLSVAQRLTKVGRYDVVARYGGDEFALLLRDVGNASRQEIEAAVHADLDNLSYRPAGQSSAIPITVSCGVALFPYGALDRYEVIQRAEERLRRAKTGGAGEAEEVRTAMLTTLSGFSMLDALVTAVDNKDRYTRCHSDDVMTYSLMIARALNLSEAMRHTVSVAALLHDVGKIGVPDHILRKPGKLTDEEYEAVKQHPQMGAIMVSSVPGLEETLDAVRHHHERWDGEGYPFGLRGAETPLIARLMAVADAYSAMTTDRPYRRGMEPAKALSILESGAGTQWDPGCVDAFLRAQRDEARIQPLKAA